MEASFFRRLFIHRKVAARLGGLTVSIPGQLKPVSVVGTPMRGRIRQIVRGQGSGVIRTSRGDAFFHKTAVGGTFWGLNVGDAVTFDWHDDAISGARASNVRVATRAPSGRASASEE
jgi:hypothetical protein